MAKQIPTEADEQKTLVDWLRLNRLCFCHVPNEGRHKVQYRRKMAALGLQPGVPDLLIFDRPPEASTFVGTAIELKRKVGGKLTDKQREWIKQLRLRHWIAICCHGADQAIEELQSLGYGRRCS